uniref:Uncharacterized protein n=1 Tax=Anguilla anguilla TaxID=7936 RepID=A0A0E9W5L1_ANGAN
MNVLRAQQVRRETREVCRVLRLL